MNQNTNKQNTEPVMDLTCKRNEEVIVPEEKEITPKPLMGQNEEKALLTEAHTHANRVVNIIKNIQTGKQKECNRDGITCVAKIVMYMGKHTRPSHYKDIGDNIGINIFAMASYMNRLLKADIVKRVGRGIYQLSSDWLEKCSFILTNTQMEILTASSKPNKPASAVCDNKEEKCKVREIKRKTRIEWLNESIEQTEKQINILLGRLDEYKEEKEDLEMVIILRS